MLIFFSSGIIIVASWTAGAGVHDAVIPAIDGSPAVPCVTFVADISAVSVNAGVPLFCC